MILVTGGGGYIGTVLIRRLLKRGHKVRVLDRLSWGISPLLSAMTPDVEVCVGDVRNPEVVKKALAGVDAVVHLAGIVGYPACDADPQDAETTNVEATRLLCSLLNGRSIVFASTGSCYGAVEGIATEDTPINPLTRYGRNKAMAETEILEAGGVCLRLATLYGISPRMRWDLLPHDFARRAVADGSLRVYEAHARRTFLHVEDAANAFLLGLRLPCGIYNVGDEAQPLTKGELAMLIASLTGCTLVNGDGHDPERRDYAVSFQKMYACGWAPHPENSLAATLPQIIAVARAWR